MSSQERHRNKKRYVYNSGKIIFSPLSSKNISLNFKDANKNKNNSKIIINNLSTEKNRYNSNQKLIKSNPNLLVLYNENNFYNNRKYKNIVNLTDNNINYIKKFSNNSKSHNKTNLGNKKSSYDYLKTDVNSSNSNIFRNKQIQHIPNISQLFPPKNYFQKSNSEYYNDFFGSSSGLFKGKLEIKNDKFKKGENNFNFKKSPEELHWYYVKSIQEGKKYQKKFDY